MSRAKRIVLLIVVVLVAAVVAIQLVPYGRDHTNPPVTSQPAWDSPRTEELAAGACFDCHSNQTVWPWYSNVAPASWLVYNDVQTGREQMNFSEWPAVGGGGLLAAAAEQVAEGEMPPLQYRLMHGAARLTDAQKQELIDGFRATAQ